ncbi:nucleolar complex-associated protein-domain-containing protein [Kickxella alabastrina]|uniref:nucleolar complex-associated protein-domain-containing protein n=1 Tax=Kickxella alabastrina TaxID=61397 RepID=UPI00222064E6|nr:nucleolar complex-associated protein-domain-containing protein [Kickxella alabastrina]KAI7830891.1 nucleolar complex-associated protein-domain-containing protein [Kickxella alabastrina]
MVKRKSTAAAGAKAKPQAKPHVYPKSKDSSKSQLLTKKNGKSAPIVPTIDCPAQSSDEEVDDDDLEFVKENAQNISFLKSLNPEKLANIPKSANSKSKSNVPAPTDLSESEDDMGLVAEDSDSDLEVFSEDEEADSSDDDAEDLLEDLDLTDSEDDDEDDIEAESMSDADSGDEDSEEKELEDTSKDYDFQNSKSRRAQKRKTMMEGAMDYEGHTHKLPIKTADGRLLNVDDSDDDEAADKKSGNESDEDDEAATAQDGKDAGSDDDDSESDSDLGSSSGSDSDEEPASRKSSMGAAAIAEAERLDLSEAPDRDLMTRKQYIVAQQNRLAGLADLVMQNPEGSSKALRMLNEVSEDEDPKVKQLGILTQLAVYCDILPDYRIRELTEKEMQMKVTRDVRQQRIHEESLVKNYSAYLKQLFTAVKRAMKIFNDETADIATGIIATRALGDLTNAHPHFNFRKDIMAALVDIYVQPSSRINFEAFTPWPRQHAWPSAHVPRRRVWRVLAERRDPGVQADQASLVPRRPQRAAALVAPASARGTAREPEDRKRKEEDLRRKEHMREKRKAMRRNKGGAALKEAKRAMHESKKQVRARKVQQEVEKSMRVAEAEVSREERERWYGETLKQVFITYFRILKQKDNIGGLLPAVLEGLAKYAHLISVEFFVDLFHLLKRIMRGQHGVGVGAEEALVTESVSEASDLVSSRVGLRTSLLCILTALHILTGQGEALNLDLKDFFYQLYALIPPLGTNPQIEATRMSTMSDGTRYTVYLTPAEVAAANATRILDEAMWEETVRSESDLMFECLELMFLGRTKVSSMIRVASYCKRLLPDARPLFSSEEQAGSGLYLKEMDDPDMCNPFATCLYELHWLQIHHHSSVQGAVSRCLTTPRPKRRSTRSKKYISLCLYTTAPFCDIKIFT